MQINNLFYVSFMHLYPVGGPTLCQTKFRFNVFLNIKQNYSNKEMLFASYPQIVSSLMVSLFQQIFAHACISLLISSIYWNAVLYTQTKYKNLNTKTYEAIQVSKLVKFLNIFVEKFKATQESENCEKISEGNGSLYVNIESGFEDIVLDTWFSMPHWR